MLLAFRELSLQPNGKLHVNFLDVGQGDSVLLQTPSGNHILIDGGPDLSTLEHLGNLMPFFKRRIEYVVLTHPDLDHLSALPEVLNRYQIKKLFIAGTKKDEPRYLKLLKLAEKNNIPIHLLKMGMIMETSDGVKIEVIFPFDDDIDHKKTNNDSIVLRVVYNDNSILLTGDIEEIAEQKILASGIDLSSSILKVAHHGSKTSSSTGFLLAVNPELAIVSSGKENRFGHPHPNVINRFKRMGISLRHTAKNGTISLEFP
ncbi:MAG: MBL fold metallo-hydrolase [Candidatus Peribacteraceae bacterium]|nr:MBL fold metallo-hydrolase [Candidatus Peribacteraceae bacterium]